MRLTPEKPVPGDDVAKRRASCDEFEQPVRLRIVGDRPDLVVVAAEPDQHDAAVFLRQRARKLERGRARVQSRRGADDGNAAGDLAHRLRPKITSSIALTGMVGTSGASTAKAPARAAAALGGDSLAERRADTPLAAAAPAVSGAERSSRVTTHPAQSTKVAKVAISTVGSFFG